MQGLDHNQFIVMLHSHSNKSSKIFSNYQTYHSAMSMNQLNKCLNRLYFAKQDVEIFYFIICLSYITFMAGRRRWARAKDAVAMASGGTVESGDGREAASSDAKLGRLRA